MKNSNDILNQQILDSITQTTRVVVHYRDAMPEQFSIMVSDGKYYVDFAFNAVKEITKAQYDRLINAFTDEQMYNTDPEVIRCGLSYDAFAESLGFDISDAA